MITNIKMNVRTNSKAKAPANVVPTGNVDPKCAAEAVSRPKVIKWAALARKAPTHWAAM
jgi:hypothetical protein